MNSLARQVLDAAKALGYSVDPRQTGGGHIVLVHPNGTRYAVAATPSEHRGVKNAIAALERLSGQKLARPNHRKGRHKVDSSVAEVEAARQRHAKTYDAKRAELDTRKAESEAIQRAERRRREIEDLMRP